jgi:hypothetical protein
VKTGGVDASAPLGVGLSINVITKSGGNTFKGSGAVAYQPTGWNGNNVANCSASASCKPATSTAVGTPTTAIIRQFDGGLGGPTSKRVSAGRTWKSSGSRISFRTPSCSTTPRKARSRTGK